MGSGVGEQMKSMLAALVVALVVAPVGAEVAVGLEDPVAGLSSIVEAAPDEAVERTTKVVMAPLPPAIWTGLTTMTGLAILGWTRRRRRS